MHGFGRLILASGDVYTGFFKQGMRHGRGKEVFASGEIEEGLFLDDEFITDMSTSEHHATGSITSQRPVPADLLSPQFSDNE